MKNIIKISFSLLCLIGIQTAAGFSDIAPDDTNAHVFQHLADVGVMNGFDDGLFHPEKLVTRAEALIIALRAGDISIPNTFDPTKIPFSDIDPNAWYMPAIARAVSLEFIGSGTTFRPNQPVSKAEFLAFLFRTTKVNYRPFLNSKIGIADDIQEDDWFSLAFAYAKKYQIAHLPADNLYRPHKSLSRFEVALMTFRQLRLFHGDAATRDFLELQAKIQQFMTLFRAGKTEEAQTHLPRILELTENLTLKRNNENAVAAQALSQSLKHLVNSIRAFKFGNDLEGLEELFLSSRYAVRTAEKSEKLSPFARDVHDIISEILGNNDTQKVFDINN
jgi:hypothetical protein